MAKHCTKVFSILPRAQKLQKHAILQKGTKDTFRNLACNPTAICATKIINAPLLSSTRTPFLIEVGLGRL